MNVGSNLLQQNVTKCKNVEILTLKCNILNIKQDHMNSFAILHSFKN